MALWTTNCAVENAFKPVSYRCYDEFKGDHATCPQNRYECNISPACRNSPRSSPWEDDRHDTLNPCFRYKGCGPAGKYDCGPQFSCGTPDAFRPRFAYASPYSPTVCRTPFPLSLSEICVPAKSRKFSESIPAFPRSRDSAAASTKSGRTTNKKKKNKREDRKSSATNSRPPEQKEPSKETVKDKKETKADRKSSMLKSSSREREPVSNKPPKEAVKEKKEKKADRKSSMLKSSSREREPISNKPPKEASREKKEKKEDRKSSIVKTASREREKTPKVPQKEAIQEKQKIPPKTPPKTPKKESLNCVPPKSQQKGKLPCKTNPPKTKIVSPFKLSPPRKQSIKREPSTIQQKVVPTKPASKVKPKKEPIKVIPDPKPKAPPPKKQDNILPVEKKGTPEFSASFGTSVSEESIGSMADILDVQPERNSSPPVIVHGHFESISDSGSSSISSKVQVPKTPPPPKQKAKPKVIPPAKKPPEEIITVSVKKSEQKITPPPKKTPEKKKVPPPKKMPEPLVVPPPKKQSEPKEAPPPKKQSEPKEAPPPKKMPGKKVPLLPPKKMSEPKDSLSESESGSTSSSTDPDRLVDIPKVPAKVKRKSNPKVITFVKKPSEEKIIPLAKKKSEEQISPPPKKEPEVTPPPKEKPEPKEPPKKTPEPKEPPKKTSEPKVTPTPKKQSDPKDVPPKKKQPKSSSSSESESGTSSSSSVERPKYPEADKLFAELKRRKPPVALIYGQPVKGVEVARKHYFNSYAKKFNAVPINMDAKIEEWSKLRMPESHPEILKEKKNDKVWKEKQERLKVVQYAIECSLRITSNPKSNLNDKDTLELIKYAMLDSPKLRGGFIIDGFPGGLEEALFYEPYFWPFLGGMQFLSTAEGPGADTSTPPKYFRRQYPYSEKEIGVVAATFGSKSIRVYGDENWGQEDDDYMNSMFELYLQRPGVVPFSSSRKRDMKAKDTDEFVGVLAPPITAINALKDENTRSQLRQHPQPTKHEKK